MPPSNILNATRKEQWNTFQGAIYKVCNLVLSLCGCFNSDANIINIFNKSNLFYLFWFGCNKLS